jgi:hypothetical protein
MSDGTDADDMPRGDSQEEETEEEQTGQYAAGKQQKVSMQRFTASVQEHGTCDQPGRRGDEEQRPAGNAGLYGIEGWHMIFHFLMVPEAGS